MTLYDQKNITWLEHATTVQISITSEIGERDGGPMVCGSPTKINGSADEQIIVWFEANWKQAWTLV